MGQSSVKQRDKACSECGGAGVSRRFVEYPDQYDRRFCDKCPAGIEKTARVTEILAKVGVKMRVRAA